MSIPEFFVPATSDAAAAEAVRKGCIKFLTENQYDVVEDRRIFRLDYIHDGQEYVAEVGTDDPRTGEPILLIFEATAPNLYYVCTPTRGVLRNYPILVGKSEVTSAHDFPG